MSITLKSSPADYSSAHEPLWHVVESTNKAVAGFEYVYDLYKSATFLTRVKSSPYGTDKYGVINVSTIIRTALNTPSLGSFDPEDFTTSLSMGADVFFTDYDVRYGEVSGGVTTSNLASGTYRAYNNYKRKILEPSTALSSGVYFLTNRPTTSKVYDGQPMIITVRLNNGVNYKRRIKSAAGATVTNVDITGTGQAVVSGFIPVNGQYFELYNQTVLDTVGAYYFENKCFKYTPYTLVFLNAFGGWDSFTFIHGRLSQDSEKKSFERNNFELSGFNMVDKSGLVYNEGNKVYANMIKNKLKLTSDILNTAEYLWAGELISSPVVYLWYDGYFHPVKLMTTNYEFKNSLQNKTETFEVEVEFTNHNTQYR